MRSAISCRRADLRGLAVPILRAALCNVQVHEGRVRDIVWWSYRPPRRYEPVSPRSCAPMWRTTRG